MVSVPVFATTLPVSSTFKVSLPLPVTVSAPWILFTTPVTAGALLPTFTVFTPAPVFTLATPPVPSTFTTSLPAPLFTLVTVPAWVEASVNVSPPDPSEMFRALNPL